MRAQAKFASGSAGRAVQAKETGVPTYDYKCQDCGHTYERFQSITADPETVCPLCQGAVKRLIGSGAGLIFKGSGFYITDYRSKGYEQARKADDKPAAAASGEGGGCGKPQCGQGSCASTGGASATGSSASEGSSSSGTTK